MMKAHRSAAGGNVWPAPSASVFAKGRYAKTRRGTNSITPQLLHGKQPQLNKQAAPAHQSATIRPIVLSAA